MPWCLSSFIKVRSKTYSEMKDGQRFWSVTYSLFLREWILSFITVVPIYLRFVKVSKCMLGIFIFWLRHAFCSRDTNKPMVDMDTKRPIFFITTLSGVPPQDLVPVPGSTYIGLSQRIKPTQGTASATKKQPETSRKTKPRRLRRRRTRSRGVGNCSSHSRDHLSHRRRPSEAGAWPTCKCYCGHTKPTYARTTYPAGTHAARSRAAPSHTWQCVTTKVAITRANFRMGGFTRKASIRTSSWSGGRN